MLRRMIQGALIAALYALLTLVLAPISYGPIQCRVSEALCVLPLFTPAAAPGLFVGCLLANLLSGELLDILFGSIATLLASLLTYWIGRKYRMSVARWLAPLPAVVVNAAVLGWLMANVYAGTGSLGWGMCALYIAAGQAIACYGLGVPLTLLLEKHRNRLFR